MNSTNKISGIIITAINSLYFIFLYISLKTFEENNERQFFTFVLIIFIILILQTLLMQKTIVKNKHLDRVFFIINYSAININIILFVFITIICLFYLLAPDLSKFNS